MDARQYQRLVDSIRQYEPRTLGGARPAGGSRRGPAGRGSPGDIQAVTEALARKARRFQAAEVVWNRLCRPEWREHVSADGIDGDALVLHVSHPAVMAAIRDELRPLAAALRGGAVGVVRVALRRPPGSDGAASSDREARARSAWARLAPAGWRDATRVEWVSGATAFVSVQTEHLYDALVEREEELSAAIAKLLFDVDFVRFLRREDIADDERVVATGIPRG